MTESNVVYFSTENSDLTEGRGHTVITGLYLNPEEAVKAVKGRNVMGIGDGDVFRVELPSKGYPLSRDNLYYGYRQGRNGKYGYGYVDLRDEPDPKTNSRYAQYLELKKEFEG